MLLAKFMNKNIFDELLATCMNNARVMTAKNVGCIFDHYTRAL